MRQVAAGHKHRPAVQSIHCPGNALAQPVVLQWGESGQADAQDRAVHPRIPEEVQGEEGPVVQGGVLFSQCPGLDTGCFCLADKLLPQFSVISDVQHGLGRTESRHIARCALAGGDVEIVGVHDGVGGGDNQHLRCPRCHLLRGGVVCVDGGLNLRFPSTSYGGDDDGRVGYDNGSYD